ncbi:MAG: isochorismatase family protein [Alphaproteobacteria bacterium]|jgi:N-carbamoylsarcosine amidase|nr:isochorismatase family protein [Alphaproteobacteria bacterium]MDA7634914.1 isochorismatase family protein [Alphaproteobacteria bacterium]MDG2467595.1 isochorismatase family protein [Alphaproteobacteria bacterium]
MTDKDMDWQELDDMLHQAFDKASEIYQQRGFQRRIGFGKKPALISVDLANAWTRPGNPFTCDQNKMDNEIIPGMQRLLAACRANGHPVIHVTTAYEVTDRNAEFTDMGLWHCKIPIDVVDIKDKELWAIDSRIAPVEGEYTLLKKRASSFHGTELAGILRAANVDTILVTGVTATACVRETVCDGIADGFRTIAVKECIGDRIPGAVAWNLFDLDAKFADVHTVDECVSYLETVKQKNS